MKDVSPSWGLMKRLLKTRPMRLVLSAFTVAALLFATFMALFAIAFRLAPTVDQQCLNPRRPATVYPQAATTADEALRRADEAYDGGNCNQAIEAYTQALALKPDYAEAYNNRAYTYMRMQNYVPALTDLDQALRIRPDYVHALMNRADIHNFYFEQDRRKAIADYDHILRLGGKSKDLNVCGHRAVAIYNLPGHEGWNGLSWLKLVLQNVSGKDSCAINET